MGLAALELPGWNSAELATRWAANLELAGWCLLAILGISEIVALVVRNKPQCRRLHGLAEIVGVASFALYVVVYLAEYRYRNRSDDFRSEQLIQVMAELEKERSARKGLEQKLSDVGQVSSEAMEKAVGVEAQQRPRHIDRAQSLKFTTHLRGPSSSIAVICRPEDLEACDYAVDVVRVLKDSGWTVVLNRTGKSDKVGVAIYAKSDGAATATGAPLREAFRSIGIDASVFIDPNLAIEDQIPSGRVAVLIGRRR